MTSRLWYPPVRLWSTTLGICLLFSGVGCAHWGETSKDAPLTISTKTADGTPPEVDFQANSGLASYEFKKTIGTPQDLAVEWITCAPKNSRGSVVVMHDSGAFKSEEFCYDWLPQTFLAQGLAVIAVNRPGYGKSTGPQDLVGSQSMSAIQEGAKEAAAKAALPKIIGTYGYGLGAVAATLLAKQRGDLGFVILGGGIYDLDDAWRKTTDSRLKSEIASLRHSEGDRAIEERSVGYDVSGLPKKISIYHGKLDVVIPPSHAKAFSDSLEASGEYQVSLQLIEGIGHEIPPQHHRKILDILIVSALPGAAHI